MKRGTESVKVAPESVPSNKGESQRYALDQVFARRLSPYTHLSGPYHGFGYLGHSKKITFID